MKKIIITEGQFSHVVKHMVNEGMDKNRIYHQAGFKNFSELKDILTYGLRKHDNGEANGIWFSVGNLFYRGTDAPLVLSLPKTDEVRDMFGFNPYDWRGSSVVIATKDIPIKFLTVESCIILKYQFKNGGYFGYLTMQKDKEHSKLLSMTYENLSGWDKDNEYIIYEDMYQILFEHPIDPKEKEMVLKNLPNFKFENLLQ